MDLNKLEERLRVAQATSPSIKLYLEQTEVAEIVELIKRQDAALVDRDLNLQEQVELNVRQVRTIAEMQSRMGALISERAAAEARAFELAQKYHDAVEAPAAPVVTAGPTIKQLAAQLDSDEKWTIAEQNAFAPFLAQFPNECSQGIQSLGSAWKHGIAYAQSLAAPQQHAQAALSAQGISSEDLADLQHVADCIKANGSVYNQYADGAARIVQAIAASQQPVAAPDALRNAFVTLESTEGRYSIVMKFNQKTDAFAMHDYLLGVGGKEYNAAPVAAAVQGDVEVLRDALRNIRDYRTDVDDTVAARSMRFYAETALEAKPQADAAPGDAHNLLTSLWTDISLRNLMRPDQVRRIEAYMSAAQPFPPRAG